MKRPPAAACCSGTGCHVLETLLRRLAASSDPDAMPAEAQAAVRSCIGLVRDDLTAYIADRHATYLARNLVHLLTGRLSREAPWGKRSGSLSSQSGLPHKLARLEQLSGHNLLSSGLPNPSSRDRNAQADEGAGMPDAQALLRQLVQATLACSASAPTLKSLQRSPPAAGFLQVLLATEAAQCVALHLLHGDVSPMLAVLLPKELLQACSWACASLPQYRQAKPRSRWRHGSNTSLKPVLPWHQV